jgi:hypothetical protein
MRITDRTKGGHWREIAVHCKGEDVNDAFGAVLVSVLNGLFGYDQYGSYNGDGLAQRMKARMGDDWNLSHEVWNPRAGHRHRHEHRASRIRQRVCGSRLPG